MPKNIIVCSDGTGNTAVKNRGTNVFKLFEAADLNGHHHDASLTPQIAIYGDGVGTENFKPLQILGLATGWGLARNVRQLYKELCRNYDPGDRIFLFGFSRGAFTVRTLAGLIHHCGILDIKKVDSASILNKKVSGAYSAYRKSYRTALMNLLLPKRTIPPAEIFCGKHCLPRDLAGPAPIEFMGVWDTVDAVGTPFHISDIINLTIHRYKFPDSKLNSSVKRACHALAIDETRDAFSPELWDKDPEDRIEQVWFSGVHSNVGGGYPKQGMSLVALEWMMERAQESGLRLLPFDLNECRAHASVLDHLYDSRAGSGVFYRWLPRDMQAICKKAGVEPKVHVTALERIAHGTDGYVPGTIAPRPTVVITEPQSDPDYAKLRARADQLQMMFQQAHQSRGPLLDDVRWAIQLGRFAYYTYLVACTGVVLAAAVPPDETLSRLNPLVYVKDLFKLIWAAATLNWTPIIEALHRLLLEPLFVIPLASGFTLAAIFYWTVKARLSRVFSEFWHKNAPHLRDELKKAQKAAASALEGPEKSHGVSAPGGQTAPLP
jgi:uncharacterized protein (DUF2235 family)